MPPLEPSGALCAPGFLVSSCSSSLFEDLEYSEPSDLFQVHLALEFLGEFSGALQCTARFQVRLSMDLLIYEPTQGSVCSCLRDRQAMWAVQSTEGLLLWLSYFLELALFCRFFLLCLFISINGPSGQDLCHLLLILCGVEILTEMCGVVVVRK